jgi:hypothetical protein
LAAPHGLVTSGPCRGDRTSSTQVQNHAAGGRSNKRQSQVKWKATLAKCSEGCNPGLSRQQMHHGIRWPKASPAGPSLRLETPAWERSRPSTPQFQMRCMQPSDPQRRPAHACSSSSDLVCKRLGISCPNCLLELSAAPPPATMPRTLGEPIALIRLAGPSQRIHNQGALLGAARGLKL